MKKIYEYSYGCWLISRIVFVFMRIYYRKIYVRGQENVPHEGPVIFAPNHKNALMDPLMILYSLPKQQVVFMARGDMFANFVVAKIMRYFKILPVFRMRDGFGNLGKNEAPFAEAVEVLKSGHKLCLMPEGQQIEQRRLLPLVKGMFRIGFHAQEQYGNHPGVKIVPVGIEYDDLCYSGQNVLIKFGKPMELSDYYNLYTEDQPKAYNALKEDLSPRIEKLMLNVASNNNYDTIYLATLLDVNNYLKKHQLEDTVWNRLLAKQNISKQYCEEENNNIKDISVLNSKMQKLYASGKSADEIYRLMQKTAFSDYLKMLLYSPLFLLGSLFMLLPYILIKFLTRNMLDSGFYSSMSFGLGVVVPMLFFIICFLVSLLFMPLCCSIILFLLIAPLSSIIAFRVKELYFNAIKRLTFKRDN